MLDPLMVHAPKADLLVLRRGGLGDTLLMVPMLRALQRRWPAARLHFAGVQEFAAVLVAYGAVAVAHSSESRGLWQLALDTGPGEAARRRLKAFARIVTDGPLPDLGAGGPEVVVFDPRVVLSGVPFALQLARQLLLEPHWPDDAWLLPPRPELPSGQQSGLQSAPVVLAPGSGGRAKCWPRQAWLGLAQRLSNAGASVAVVVGPVEQEVDDPRRWPWPAATTCWVDRSPIELAEALAQARWFVGNDSGPTHLAAMLGVPVVAIFGPTDPEVWAPVGSHVQVVGGDGRALAEITEDEVFRRVR